MLALGGSVLAFIGGLAWYINRWYSISESGGEIVYKLNLKDVKTVGFILFLFGALGRCRMGSVFIEYTKAG